MTPLPTLIGDFSGNAILDTADIDRLIDEMGGSDPQFDLNSDGAVNEFDLTYWIHDLKKTYFGDANLDGEFASSDLVLVFGAGEYEDEIESNSIWSTGDWTGDRDFTSGDLVRAFQDGGYEQGPRGAVVPEPTTILLTAVGMAALWFEKCRTKQA